MTPEELPAYSDLVAPTVRAVIRLGGSATAREIPSQVVSDLAPTEEMLAVMQPKRPQASVLMERISWARSSAKLIGALKSPKRGVFLVTPLGKELAALPAEEAAQRTIRLDREYQRNRPQRARERRAEPTPADPEEAEAEAAAVEEEESLFRSDTSGTEPERWQDALLARLHRLRPDAFEEFVLYLLRLYGLQLERVGGTGDEGIDGIGTAPISPVLSSRVAVQVKRYDPNGKAVGRETVALFQRDAQTKGAERAILVTLGKFSEPARRAATITSQPWTSSTARGLPTS